MTAAPGWYPDPSGAPGHRYWDGFGWTVAAPLPARPTPAGVVVTGPNHAVHAILSLLTFWACGGWIWVWLIVAAQNNKRIQQVDAYGNVIVWPMTPQQIAAAEANKRAWMIGGAVGVGLMALILIISVVISR